MISYSQGKKKKFQLSSCLLFIFPLDLLARSLGDNVLGAVGGSKTCICALDLGFGSYAGAFDFFILHFPSLYQIHFCICCNFPPPPQANCINLWSCQSLSIRAIFSDFVCAPFVLMKPEERISRSEDTEDTGF